jgi:hypothetical protein
LQLTTPPRELSNLKLLNPVLLRAALKLSHAVTTLSAGFWS